MNTILKNSWQDKHLWQYNRVVRRLYEGEFRFKQNKLHFVIQSVKPQGLNGQWNNSVCAFEMVLLKYP